MWSIVSDITCPNPPDYIRKEQERKKAQDQTRATGGIGLHEEEVHLTKKERKRKRRADIESGRFIEEKENVEVIKELTETEVQLMPEKVQERIRKVETTRVQPIIHRDRYQVELHQIIQPIVDKVTKATILEIQPPIVENRGQREEEATWTPELKEGLKMGHAPVIVNSSEVVSTEHQREDMPPIVEEVVHRKIIEHITPVVLKEVVLPNLAIVETIPEDVLKSSDVHTLEGKPVVIEKLTIKSGVEELEERVQRLEHKLHKMAQERIAEQELKAKQREAKLELKAQKCAAKMERQALKETLAQEELERKADIVIRTLHEQRIAELEAKMKQVRELPSVVVTQVDERESEELPSPVGVVRSVDEVTTKQATTTSSETTQSTETSQKLDSYSPMTTTPPREKEYDQTGNMPEGKEQQRTRVSENSTTPQQTV